MSQNNFYNLDPTSVRDEHSQRKPSVQKVPTYSLSGNTGYQPSLYRSRTASFVTAEYEQLNPDYNQPESSPVWGLAKPLPRVVRSGMRSRHHSVAVNQGGRNESNNNSALDEATQKALDLHDSGTDHEHVQAQRHKVKFSEPATLSPSKLPGQSAIQDFGGSTSGYTTSLRSETAKHSISSDQEGDKILQPFEQYYHNKWGQFRYKMRQPLTEFLGTFVALVLALSTSLTHATSQGTYGDSLSANIAWGFGIMLGIYTCGGISGGHLNPAISIMLSVFRGFPWRQCYKYIIAQVLGAFAAAGVVYSLYRNTIFHSDGGLLRSSTGVAFYTRPQDWISNATAFFTEFVATAILAGVILALGDDSNAPPGAGMQAFIIGLLVFGLCMGFSYNTGPALNPARDLGPRLVTLAAGYGGEEFTDRNCWWIWGCWVAPITGSLVGAFVYDALVFTGGESPLNYPNGRWSQLLTHTWEKVTHRFPKKNKKVDEEKMEGSG